MKNNKLLTKVLIILIIIAVTLIAFVGIYVKDKNTTKNIVKENMYGMNLKGYRSISLVPSTETETIYYDAEGKKVEKQSDAIDENEDLKEGYSKQEEQVNKNEVLTAENFEEMKQIVEKRLKKLMDNYRENDEKLSERNKEINQFEWVKLMNNYKDCAEEIIH